jgi:uncharacterized membrane protein YbhN (UPF0104 family)
MHVLLRLGVSLGLLLTVAWLLDAGDVAARLAHLRAPWVLLALGISVLQLVLSAYRWRVTAGRLGIHLPFKHALREYYLATFLNQVLPGGVLGDVSRAWRHARVQTGPVIRTVILERASGQAVMVAAAVFSLLIIPRTFGVDPWLAIAPAAIASGAIVLGLLHARRRQARTAEGLVGLVWRDVHAALLARDVVTTQLAVSALVVGSYIATYVVAARAVGVATPTSILAPLIAPVLMSMLIPVSIAGWGVREATAAGLWIAVGLTAEDGVAISAAYGLLVLLSSLPGALFLLTAGRDRTERLRPSESGGNGDEVPVRGSRSAVG